MAALASFESEDKDEAENENEIEDVVDADGWTASFCVG